MNCQDCQNFGCNFRHKVTACPFSSEKIEDPEPKSVIMSEKSQWISETVVKLIALIPYEYVTSGVGGQTSEPRHLYAARIAKEMADQIFG